MIAANKRCLVCRGRSGLHRTTCWLGASRGDSKESAAENIPPATQVVGKGEKVR